MRGGGREDERGRTPQFLYIDFYVPHTGMDLGRIELIYESYQPGDYVLTISAIDIEEQTTTLQVNLTIQGTIVHINHVIEFTICTIGAFSHHAHEPLAIRITS